MTRNIKIHEAEWELPSTELPSQVLANLEGAKGREFAKAAKDCFPGLTSLPVTIEGNTVDVIKAYQHA
jgi:hypothetical protein